MPEYEYRLVVVETGYWTVLPKKQQDLYAVGWNQTSQYVIQQGDGEQCFSPIHLQVWRRERPE